MLPMTARGVVTATTILATMLIITSCALHAQANADSLPRTAFPLHQFGFGASNVGFHIQYSFSPTFHAGLHLNIDLNSYDSASTTVSGSNYEIGPFLKYLLLDSGMVIPYVHTALVMIRPSHSESSLIRGSRRPKADGTWPSLETRLTLSFGAEHFFNHHVGVYAHVDVARAFLDDPTSFSVGLVGGVAGVEFFF
jgi:hypothetical protein